MSEPEATKNLIDGVTNNTTWLGMLWVSLLGFAARLLIGRYLKTMDEMKVLLKDIDVRLAVLEGRFDERDHHAADSGKFSSPTVR